MYFIRHTWLLLCFCACLAGCTGRQVDVIQAHQFKLMADRLPNEMIARDILDSSRNYYPTMLPNFTNDYGHALYERLASDFVFGDEVSNNRHLSFAQIVRNDSKNNSAQMRKAGFSIVSINTPTTKKRTINARIERRVDVDMVAITDWNGDGLDDWIVAGKLLRTRGAIPRIYYVVISNPPATGMLRGNVVAVYDDLGVVGRLYMRDSLVKTSSPVEDVVPGLKPVTTPPESTTPNTTTIKERVLD